jgi:hypothetical protein
MGSYRWIYAVISKRRGLYRWRSYAKPLRPLFLSSKAFS